MKTKIKKQAKFLKPIEMIKYGNTGYNLYRKDETIFINNKSKIIEEDFKYYFRSSVIFL